MYSHRRAFLDTGDCALYRYRFIAASSVAQGACC
jgi:hypothetical protein